MDYTSTFVFVLALGAGVFAALAWIISWRLTSAQASWRLQTERAMRQRWLDLAQRERSVSAKLAELERHSPTKLGAEVVALSEAVERLAATHRRFAGRFDAHFAKANGAQGELDVDPEFQALIDLQRSTA